MPTFLRALRPHQWIKNFLVFVPLFVGHAWGDPGKVVAAFLAFVAFCLAASGLYLVNDVCDREADRQHPQKCKRPVAAGAIRVPMALAASVVLLAAAFGVAFVVGPAFASVLAGYFVVALAYSFWLKRVPVLDLVLLAGFYTVRVFAGGLASEILVSTWLLVFVGFFFYSLANVKRVSELVAGMSPRSMRRGYLESDRVMLMASGLASGLLSVLVVSLYVNSPHVELLYTKPRLLLLLCPLLVFWICRIWLLAWRGEVDLDPVVFACRDVGSWLTGILGLAIVLAAR